MAAGGTLLAARFRRIGIRASAREWAAAAGQGRSRRAGYAARPRQADAVRASTEAQQDGSAYRAVAAAKQFKGSTVTMTYEAGLQALEPRNFSGPAVAGSHRHLRPTWSS